jgi:hypothetical protein
MHATYEAAKTVREAQPSVDADMVGTFALPWTF